MLKEHLPDPMPRGFARLVPDLVLETRSPGDTVKELEYKSLLWVQAGVREVWALDTMARTLALYRKGQQTRLLGAGDVLEGSELLPGFSYKFTRLFRDSTAQP